ncbi:MAG: DUF2157 domain-containing protein [Anaerolineae bacterium]
MTDLKERLENWQEAGLITADQAESIAGFESLAESRRVSLREIFVYVGGFFVLMAVGFGLQVLWDDLGSLSRVMVVAIPTVILWVAGELLRRRGAASLMRGARVCWMVAAWLTAILIAVTLNEWTGLKLEDDPWLVLWASLGALPLAISALLVLPGFPQGLAPAVLTAILSMSITNLVAETWAPGVRWAMYLPWAVVGAIGLAAAEFARRRDEGNLVWLFNLVGAWAWLFFALIVSLEDKLPAWETLLFVESLAIIAWSVVRQSRVLLYSGALFLLVYIADINFEYFSDRLGLPAVLLITGVALIAIGLGVDRLRRRESPAHTGKK